MASFLSIYCLVPCVHCYSCLQFFCGPIHNGVGQGYNRRMAVLLSPCIPRVYVCCGSFQGAHFLLTIHEVYMLCENTKTEAVYYIHATGNVLLYIFFKCRLHPILNEVE